MNSYGKDSEPTNGKAGGVGGNVARGNARGGGGGGGAASERMRMAIAAIARGEDCDDELRAAARELVAKLRAENQPPERALVTIKQVLGDAGLPAPPMGSNEGDGATSPEAMLYRDLIAWSIRCYYEDVE